MAKSEPTISVGVTPHAGGITKIRGLGGQGFSQVRPCILGMSLAYGLYP